MGKFINGSVPTGVVNQLPSSAIFYRSVLLTSSTVDDSHGSLRLVVADFIAASLRPDSSTKFSPAMSSSVDTVRSQQGPVVSIGLRRPLDTGSTPGLLDHTLQWTWREPPRRNPFRRSSRNERN
jgi:hypothetical protein